MRPATGLSADGPTNIYEAVQVATDKQSKDRGVLVVMNEQIDGARGVTKAHGACCDEVLLQALKLANNPG
jgi:L-asparaginase